MSESDNHDDPSKQDMTRRAVFTLGAAVATFGAALGMRSSTAREIEIRGIKINKVSKRIPKSKAEHKVTIKLKNNKRSGQKYLKLDLDRNK